MVSEIRKSLYVDELISEGPTEERAKRLKSEATEMLAVAKLICTSGLRTKRSQKPPVKTTSHLMPRNN